MPEPTYTGAGYSSQVSCDTCGALLPAIRRQNHTDWHAAVDARTEPDDA